MIDPLTLGKQLRIARKRAHLTQAEVAAHLGVVRTTLVTMEAGTRRVTHNEFVTLQALYGCDVTAIDPELPTEQETTAKKRVLQRVLHRHPDAGILATLQILSTDRKTLETMVATILHLLIEQESEEAV